MRTVRDRLLRYETDWGERRVRVDAKGQVARTDFQILERAEDATLLRATLHTGAPSNKGACSISGHPILGDTKYGGTFEAKEVGRLCLRFPIGRACGDDRLDVSAARVQDGEDLGELKS